MYFYLLFFIITCTFTQDNNSNKITISATPETTTVTDYFPYFKNINATVNFYTPKNNHYTVHNQALSKKMFFTLFYF